ncbi:hypothetical protein, partial [Bradyrhizobium diazoefficiens]|uniref:hypothetical protein n=1 Tax=Bradyrhizobium diazoefficiens TaxID=1355477 RepID=UPI00057678D6
FWFVGARTSWLTAVAARTAVECGEAAIERNLQRLVASRKPITAFDALFGLAALGLSLPSERARIRAEICKAREIHLPAIREHVEHFKLVYSNALWLLSSADCDDLRADAFVPLEWKRNGPRGLATAAALYGDPTEFTPSGRYVGFAMLPFVMGGRLEEHYPKIRQRNPSSRKVAHLLARGWYRNEPKPPPMRTLH